MVLKLKYSLSLSLNVHFFQKSPPFLLKQKLEIFFYNVLQDAGCPEMTSAAVPHLISSVSILSAITPLFVMIFD